MTDIWHGTPGGYSNHKCRCAPCSEAFREYQRGWDERRLAIPCTGNYTDGCRCPSCVGSYRAAYMKTRRAKLREAVKDGSLKKHGLDAFKAGCRCQECRDAHDANRWNYYYSLTPDDHAEILEKQGGVCAICKQAPGGSKRVMLHVDHDHETGLVRGLLCTSCNTGLGKLGDSIEGLERALAYLKSIQKVPKVG